MYKLIFTDSYNKRLKKFLKSNKNIKNQYIKVIQIIEINPYHPSLRLHKLSGRLGNLYSISINMQYRISIEFLIDDKTIIPITIGTHKEVYN